jgi:hypothetical protein
MCNETQFIYLRERTSTGSSKHQVFAKLAPFLSFSIKTLDRYYSDGLKAASLAGAGYSILF